MIFIGIFHISIRLINILDERYKKSFFIMIKSIKSRPMTNVEKFPNIKQLMVEPVKSYESISLENTSYQSMAVACTSTD